MSSDALKHWLSFAKFIIGTVLVGGLVAVGDYRLKSLSMDLKSLQLDHDNVQSYLSLVLDKSLGTQLGAAEAFASLSSMPRVRENWSAYAVQLRSQFESEEKKKDEVEKRQQVLAAEIAKGKSVSNELLTTLTAELAEKSAQLKSAKDDMRRFEQSLLSEKKLSAELESQKREAEKRQAEILEQVSRLNREAEEAKASSAAEMAAKEAELASVKARVDELAKNLRREPIRPKNGQLPPEVQRILTESGL
jgi:chromosome segregation ATPase